MHHITQPAISRRIDALEKELGCKLFIRNSHSVFLTDAGQEFFDYAIGVMNMTEATKQRMENISNGRVGRIRLSLVPHIAEISYIITLSRGISCCDKLSILRLVGISGSVRDVLCS